MASAARVADGGELAYGNRTQRHHTTGKLQFRQLHKNRRNSSATSDSWEVQSDMSLLFFVYPSSPLRMLHPRFMTQP